MNLNNFVSLPALQRESAPSGKSIKKFTMKGGLEFF